MEKGGRIATLKPIKSEKLVGVVTADKPTKQTFKEKYYEQKRLAEAEASRKALVVIHDRQTMCIDILVHGHPQSFVDFFMLSHPEFLPEAKAKAAQKEHSEAVPPAAEESGEPPKEKDEVGSETYALLRENLVSAEIASWKGALMDMYTAYLNIATYFEGIQAQKKAILFYKKCIDIASKAGDSLRELEANRNLARVYQQVQHLNSTATHRERQLEIAHSLEDEELIKEALQNLLQTYSMLADEAESMGELEQSIEFNEKCIQIAMQANDEAEEGLAKHRIGNLWQRLNQPRTAIDYQQQYLAICRSNNNKVGEGKACCALAEAYQGLGDIPLAIANLEIFLQFAKLGDPAQQAKACCKLGIIYHQQKKFDRAAVYFEKFFEIARFINNQQMADAARVNLGICRGSIHAERFMEVVASELDVLMRWKIMREPFYSIVTAR